MIHEHATQGATPLLQPTTTRSHRVFVGLAAMAALHLAAAGCVDDTGPGVRERPNLVKISGERPGTTRLDGLKPIQGFAKGRDCTLMHCLELVLQGVGRKIGYDELMGVSGLAFRLQIRSDRWDVGNPDPAVGASCLDDLFAAIGFDYDLRVVRREEHTKADALRSAIAASIDRSMPVLAANIIPPEDWGIITGYQRRGWAWICRSYHGDAMRYDRGATGWPTAVLILTRKNARPAPKPLHAKSLRKAISLYDQPAQGSYALGSNAFEHWCQALRSAGTRDYVHPNAWTYVGLIDARGAAVRYLRSIASEFGAKRAHVLRAAELYEQETRLLIDGLRDVPSEKQFPRAMPPSEMRSRQVSTLLRAKTIEQEAIDALRKAI